MANAARKASIQTLGEALFKPAKPDGFFRSQRLGPFPGQVMMGMVGQDEREQNVAIAEMPHGFRDRNRCRVARRYRP
jgi:hypothetical protein